jgi:hypothetical protein
LLETSSVIGVAAGTPVATADGKYLLITSNSNNFTTGNFNVFDKASPTAPIYSVSDPIEIYSPIGYYHKPAQGYFTGGFDNTNDVFIWMYDNGGDATVSGGSIWAFQFPVDGTTTNLNITLVGPTDRQFQSPNPPVLTNSGLSMYWAVSKNEQRCWVDGAVNMGRYAFDKAGIKVYFPRGSPPSASAKAPPSLSDAGPQPIVYGPTADSQIFRMNYNYSEMISVPVAIEVTSRIAVSPDAKVIYYATPSPDSKLYQLDGTSLAQIWQVSLGVGVSGHIALSPNGDYIVLADIVGNVYGFKVADAIAAPVTTTLAPAAAPVLGGTPAPSMTGGGGTGTGVSTSPSDMPSGMGADNSVAPVPSLVSSGSPMASPVASPVASPMSAPVGKPFASPTTTTSTAAKGALRLVCTVVASAGAIMLM